MKPYEFFKDEDDFQRWAVNHITEYGCHTQPITGDPKYPGIPDLSIGMPMFDVWAEAKCWKKEHDCWATVEEAMGKERKLTAQQRDWLRERQSRGASICGVLIAWRNKHSTNYVSFIPIYEWDRVIKWNFATLALSHYTETLNRLVADKTTLVKLISEAVFRG